MSNLVQHHDETATPPNAKCVKCGVLIDDDSIYDDFAAGPYCEKCISHSLYAGCYALQTDIRNYRNATFLVIHGSTITQTWFQRAFAKNLSQYIVGRQCTAERSITWKCINDNRVIWLLIRQTDYDYLDRYDILRDTEASAVFVGDSPPEPDPYFYEILALRLRHQARPVNTGEPLLRPYLYQSGYAGSINPLKGRLYPEDIMTWVKSQPPESWK